MIKRASFLGTALSALALSFGVFHQPTQAQSAVNSSFRYQDMMEPCSKKGYVDLVAGAAKDGGVICRDGSSDASVQYKDYAEMMAHFLAGSFLVGFRLGVGENLDQGVAWVNTPEGQAEINQEIEKATTGGVLVLPEPYRDRMKQEVSFFLANPQRMKQLMGTQKEYAIVAKNFCSPKGQSISAMQELVPNLKLTQLYAVCAMEDEKTNPS